MPELAQTTDEVLSSMKRPRPPADAGDYWTAIPHTDLVRIIDESMITKEWKCTEMVPFMSKDKKDLFCLFEVDSIGTHKCLTPTKIKFGFIVVNSNARRHALTFHFGLLFDQHVFYPFVNKSCKHTRGLQLAEVVNDTLKMFTSKINTCLEEVEELKLDVITETTASTLTSGLALGGVVPWSACGKALKMFLQSKGRGCRSRFNLIQCFLKVATGGKGRAVSQITRLRRAHSIKLFLTAKAS